MDARMEMLAAARLADVERGARERRRNAIETCRRWVLGIVPIERRCDAA